MTNIYNIYCDESCHLDAPVNRSNRFMVLGGVLCPQKSKRTIFEEIKRIKSYYGITKNIEVKWKKVSVAKLDAYIALINYFFDCDNLSFRAVIIDKSQLNHEKFGQSHDQFYYKMYWHTLERLIDPSHSYNIFLDIKDTQGIYKILKLKEVLENSKHDFRREIIDKIQEIRSHEVVIMQITDLLIGAISYANRFPNGGESPAKNKIVEILRARSELTLTKSSLLGAKKFNLFRWEAQI